MRISLAIAAIAVVLSPLAVSAALPSSGTLVKASGAAVYWYGNDGKRYVFPDEKTYFTWFTDFSGVQTISDNDLASLQIGGNVTYKPGVKMVKIVSDPTVYAVSGGGLLRPIADEATAAALYGSGWNRQINDIPDSFFTNYKVGTAVASTSDFAPAPAMTAATSIDADLAVRAGATPVVPTPPSVPTVPLPPMAPVVINPSIPDATGSVAAGTAVAGAVNVVLARFQLTALNEDLQLDKVRMFLQSPMSARSVKRLALYDGPTLVGGPVAVDGSGNANFSGVTFIIPRNDSNTLTVAADLNTIPNGAQDGDNLAVTMHIPITNDGTFQMHGLSSNTVMTSSAGGDKIGNAKLVRGTSLSILNVALPSSILTEGDVIADRVRIPADSADQVSLKKLTFSINKTSTIAVNSASLREVGTGQDLPVTTTMSGCTASSSTCLVTFVANNELNIGPGQARVFELRLNVSGTTTASSLQTSLLGDTTAATGKLSNSGTGIDSNTIFNFIWSDNSAVPHTSADAGSSDWSSGIYLTGLPTDVQTLSR